MNSSRNKTAVLIAGPTASGKSAVAIKVARELDGVIINADAMQLYAGLRVLTSRPTEADERATQHRLYGTVPPGEVWSAGRWLAAARQEMEAAWTQGKVPVVTGGTGLYFKALEEGLSHVPPVPQGVRDHWRERLKAEGAPALHAELARLAPEDAARLEPGDSQRIVRCLEVIEATGKPLSAHFLAAKEASVLKGVAVRRVAIVPPRDELYAVIDARFEGMMAMGAAKEVEALLALRLPQDVPVMKAIGVKPLADMLAGELAIAQAVELAKRQSRNYAKRQMTWIRNQMADWPVVQKRTQAIEVLLHG
ncbi:MAG: tRNA (adenosine(37)-N6)-dimethylallyltransferase MiaA [Anderseniella sp.]|jgi:tRNA dimethylallyltransferase|nr:tRNA (adenosine(37)-N6)-dimethylallyltransferase MiaA [Anderseniella sp.]